MAAVIVVSGCGTRRTSGATAKVVVSTSSDGKLLVARPAYQAPEPPEHAGIIGTPTSLGGVPVPFSAAEFTVTNMWLNLVGHVYYKVYAGFRPSDRRQGELMIDLVDADTGNSVSLNNFFHTHARVPDPLRPPARTGPIRLTAVRPAQIDFSYQGGHGSLSLRTFTFDLSNS